MAGAAPLSSRALSRLEGDGDSVVGSFGGHPRGVRAHVWPRCAVCGAPMCHMAQFDAGPWLDLGPWARLTVFICHATGGRCEDWDPWKGANKVLLQRLRDDNLYDGPPTVRVYRRVRLGAGSPVDERDWVRTMGEQGVVGRAASERLRFDKLGGAPAWLHSDDTPRSKVNASPMRLILQMTTQIVAFDITRGGVAWVFIDPADPGEDAGRLVWQGG